MKFLLDTNVLSELRKSRDGDRAVFGWAAAEDNRAFAISVISIMELEYGALAVLRRDPVFSKKLSSWLNETIRPRYAGRTLDVDERIALCCAGMLVPKTRQLTDALIAATALVHDLTIVTRNTADFEPLGVRVLNPWLA